MTTHISDDLTVLVPAAGRVPEGLIGISNISCSAMIPVGGRPLIHWTISYLHSLGARRFIIAVSQLGGFIEDFVELAFGNDLSVRFIQSPSNGGIGRTISDLADAVTTASALVVLGDTHFELADPGLFATGPFVLSHPAEEVSRWSIVDTAPDGTLGDIRRLAPGDRAPGEALIGVAYFPDAALLKRVAAATVEAAAEKQVTPGLAGVLRRYNDAAPMRVVRASMWLDCGNPDMQASSHKELLEARVGTAVTIDGVGGTITKRSSDAEELVNEINYLRLLPPDLRVFYPRVLNHSVDWADPWVELEYYGYPTLSDLFLFQNVDPGVWQRIFVHLDTILRERFGAHTRPPQVGAVREMYFDRTRRRLANLTASEELTKLLAFEGKLTINGRDIVNLPALWKRLEMDVVRLQDNARSTVVHGELWLSHILYDVRSRICKLIDPRGSFGGAGLYGDPRYDIAKLWLSVHGLYDFIANDLYLLNMDGAIIELTFRETEAHKEIERRFASVFFPHHDRREITLIAALLFASFPALHPEHPQRQLALYLRAVQLLDEAYEGIEISPERAEG